MRGLGIPPPYPHRLNRQSGAFALTVPYEQLDAETFRAAVVEARANGMTVYAHVPSSLDVFALLEMKIDSMEHLDAYAEAMARDGFTTDREYAWAEWWANADRAKFGALARATVKAGSWTVPTFAITYGRLASADPDAYFDRPEARLLPLWADGWRQNIDRFEANRPIFERPLTEKIAFVSALKEAGAKILIGTDGPNPFVTPGYAIHDELAAFSLAGYSSEEIIRIATVEAARFIGEKGRTGTVTVGAPADLILLSEDPVEDLAALREPLGAMVAGHWHSRERIENALNRRAEKMAKARVDANERIQ